MCCSSAWCGPFVVCRQLSHAQGLRVDTGPTSLPHSGLVFRAGHFARAGQDGSRVYGCNGSGPLGCRYVCSRRNSEARSHRTSLRAYQNHVDESPGLCLGFQPLFSSEDVGKGNSSVEGRSSTLLVAPRSLPAMAAFGISPPRFSQ